MDPFVGEIRMVGFNYAPRGWAFCNGALLAIQSNAALFSLLGTQYGGDGRTTFALPDLQGRAPIHQGQGSGLSQYVIGQSGGSIAHTLITSELPVHTHTVNADSSIAATNVATGALLGRAAARSGRYYGPNTPVVSMGPLAVGPNSGGGAAHSNQQPYLAVNFIIALQGIFPSRQ